MRGFVKFDHLSKYTNEKGYTLVETLVAIGILMGVLVPATLFLGKITANQRNRDLIVASQLAREEMEKIIAYQLYENNERTIKLNNKNYQITRSIENQSGLVHIVVKVTRRDREKPLVELKTLRIDLSY